MYAKTSTWHLRARAVNVQLGRRTARERLGGDEIVIFAERCDLAHEIAREERRRVLRQFLREIRRDD